MLFRSEANAIKIGHCFCFQPFTIPRRTRIVIRKKCVRKNLDIGACFCLKGWFSVREMYQKFHLVGVFGKRYLAFVFFCYSKVFRLHSLKYDAAAEVLLNFDDKIGYCYMIGRELKTSLLGCFIGLLFSPHRRLLLSSIFSSFNVWSSVSGIALILSMQWKLLLRSSLLSSVAVFRGIQFILPEGTNPQTKQFVNKNNALSCAE